MIPTYLVIFRKKAEANIAGHGEFYKDSKKGHIGQKSFMEIHQKTMA